MAQADYGTQALCEEISREGARIARAAADRWSARTPEQPRFVAGSIGPMNRTLSMSPKVDDPAYRAVTFDEVRDAYAEQVRGLVDGGADILLIETIFDTLNAKAAIAACQEVLEERGADLPVMISVTVTDRSGRTLSGQTVEAFWNSVAHARPLSVGINCALGAEEMRPWLAELAATAEGVFVSCHPNAGLPNAFGGYDEAAATTGGLLGEFARDGWSTSSAAAAAPRPTTSGPCRRGRGRRAARRPPAPGRAADPLQRPRAAGHPARRRNFLMIGERTNVTGSRRFARTDPGRASTTTAVEVAREQVRGGANIIDVNMDEGMLDGEAAMTTLPAT